MIILLGGMIVAGSWMWYVWIFHANTEPPNFCQTMQAKYGINRRKSSWGTLQGAELAKIRAMWTQQGCEHIPTSTKENTQRGDGEEQREMAAGTAAITPLADLVNIGPGSMFQSSLSSSAAERETEGGKLATQQQQQQHQEHQHQLSVGKGWGGIERNKFARAQDYCKALMRRHGVMPGKSWGSLAGAERTKWIEEDCDNNLDVGKRKPRMAQQQQVGEGAPGGSRAGVNITPNTPIRGVTITPSSSSGTITPQEGANPDVNMDAITKAKTSPSSLSIASSSNQLHSLELLAQTSASGGEQEERNAFEQALEICNTLKKRYNVKPGKSWGTYSVLGSCLLPI
jgi:hypothetical protein